MQRCLDIAKNGLSAAMPNPSVGAVIVVKDRIIAEGFTSAFGGAHAEVNAINAVASKSLLSQATMYVSLEPCSHFGKTPPCCDLIVKHKIPHVVVGCLDPNPKVSGAGIQRMKDAGIDVVVGVFEQECRESNKRFFSFFEKKRPFIILKWAQSSDGFLSPKHRIDASPVWLTNQYSRQLVHKWRTEEMAILIGSQTAIDDNPSLTARDWSGKNPIRLLIDKDNRVPRNAKIFDNPAETIVLNHDNIDFETGVVQQILDLLYQKNLQSVIVEGGAKTLQSFIDANFWDEARIFESQKQLFDGTKAPVFSGVLFENKIILTDKLSIYKNL